MCDEKVHWKRAGIHVHALKEQVVGKGRRTWGGDKNIYKDTGRKQTHRNPRRGKSTSILCRNTSRKYKEEHSKRRTGKKIKKEKGTKEKSKKETE